MEKDAKKKHISNILMVLLIIAILEITLFNINSFRLIFGKYTEREYVINEITGEKGEGGEEVSVKLNDINIKVGTLKINMDSDKVITYTVSYIDELTSGYRSLPSKVFVNDIESSKSIPLFLTGYAKNLFIKFEIPKGTNYKIKSIIINEPIKPYFNVDRFLIISLFVILIYAIKNINLFSMPYNRKNKWQYVIIVAVVILYMALLYWCSSTSIGKQYYAKTNFYSEMYVDALMKGQTYLDEEPSSLLTRIK